MTQPISGIIHEEWRSISRYANYQVSNIGRVRNVETERILKPSIKHNGYYHIGLYKDKSQKFLYIHRLVAQEFIENPENQHAVDHINHDNANNTILNLRWVSNSENSWIEQNNQKHPHSTKVCVSIRKRISGTLKPS